MCTKLPNWDISDIEIGDKGYVTTMSYVAGEKYYDRNSDSQHTIKFTNVYLKDFIKVEQKKEIIL